ncbi:hypothetical protein [Pseudonocardia sp. H11422]|nr:hypothetical protein [Pseudonocardia sp. H11422]
MWPTAWPRRVKARLLDQSVLAGVPGSDCTGGVLAGLRWRY